MDTVQKRLNHLKKHLEAFELSDTVLQLAAQAVNADMYEYLSMVHPAAIAPYVADTLNEVGNHLRGAQPEMALIATQGAVAVIREQTQRQPDLFDSELAVFLNNLGARLLEVSRPDEARDAFGEAVSIRRRLLGTEPQAAHHLASALKNLAQLNVAQARVPEGLAMLEEVLTIRRTQSEDYAPYLASALYVLATALAESDRREEACDRLTESIEIYRGLGPQFQLFLTLGLQQRAGLRAALGDAEGAEADRAEADRAEAKV